MGIDMVDFLAGMLAGLVGNVRVANGAVPSVNSGLGSSWSNHSRFVPPSDVPGIFHFVRFFCIVRFVFWFRFW